MSVTTGRPVRVILGILVLFVAAPARQASNDNSDIAGILRSTAAYCEKIKAIALYYVVRERIEYSGYAFREKPVAPGESDPTSLPGQGLISVNRGSYRESNKRSLTYDYQLIRRKEEFEEKRTLLEENGQKKRVENAQLDIRFKATNLVFGPVGFLSRYWQPYFRYELVGRDRVDGKMCAVLRASPKRPMDENNNIARIWVGENDHSVLRIEWEPQSLGYQEVRTIGSHGSRKQTVVCRVDYGIEKNGVRFPSRLVSQEILAGSQIDDRRVLSQVTYTYSDYRFFTVGVEVKY